MKLLFGNLKKEGCADWWSTVRLFVWWNYTRLCYKTFGLLIVWHFFLSLSLFSPDFFFSFPFLLTWIQSLRWTPMIFHIYERRRWSDQNVLAVTWTLSWPITRLYLLFNRCQSFCPPLFVCVDVCTPSLLPTSPPSSYLFFLLCGKQMKNLGRKAVSACLLKGTIFARGECCSSCAAERARKRGDRM